MSSLKNCYPEVPQVLDEIYRGVEIEYENACEILDSPDVVPVSIYLQAQTIRSLSEKLMGILNLKEIWGPLEDLFEGE